MRFWTLWEQFLHNIKRTPDAHPNVRSIKKPRVVPRQKTNNKPVISMFETRRENHDLERIMEDCRTILNIQDDVRIKIGFGRKAKRILGSVRLEDNVSLIRISRYLCDFRVPEFILEEVILHEMIHIKTGYGSVLDKEYQHAHRGGVIRKEMQALGKAELYDRADQWIKINWIKHIRSFNRMERKYARK